MGTVNKIKRKLIKHVQSMELEKMSVCDISIYADIVKKLIDLDKPDMLEALTKTMATLGGTHSDNTEVKSDG